MKTLIIIIYAIVAVALTIITLMQSKEDEGASSTITGGSTSFYEKNKGRTKEGMLKKNTIILRNYIYSISNYTWNNILI